MEVSNGKRHIDAVVMIDMQPGFLDQLPAWTKARVLKNHVHLLQYCAKNDVPLVYAEFNVEDRGRTYWLLKRQITGIKNSTLVEKEESSIYRGTNVADILRKYNADTVLITGIFDDACVLKSARDLHEIVGIDVVVAQNVIGGNNNLFKDTDWYQTIPFLNTWRDAFAGKREGTYTKPTSFFEQYFIG